MYPADKDLAEKTNLIQSESDKTKILLAEDRKILQASDLKKMAKAKKENGSGGFGMRT